jgi:hypothetical protein
MKTHILRDPDSVQPQKARFLEPVPTPETPPAAPLQPCAVPRSATLFSGLDVHSESIAVSIAPSDSSEVRRYGLIGGSHDDVLRLAKRLQAAHPGHALQLWHEAGPHGYPLCRCLRRHACPCDIAAPSKIPRAPGQRVKTNRRDADHLARLSRAGELTALHVPEPEDEAVRDLLRARWQTAKQQPRARQQLKSFLLRHNLRYAGTKAWTAAHLRYLATIQMPFGEQQFVFQEMVHAISEAGARLERFDTQLPRAVAGWRFEPVPGGLRTFSPWRPGPPAQTDGTGRTPSPCAHTGRQKHSARLTSVPPTPLGTFGRGFVQPWNADNVK